MSGSRAASDRLSAVVFDLDGLMFNTEALYQQVGTELLARRGKRFEAELLDRIMGRKSAVALQIMIDWHGLSDTVPLLAEESEAIFAEILDTQLQCMSGLEPLLEALETAGIPKAIATGSSRRFVDNVLGRFNFAPRFKFVLTSEDVIEGKPHPEIYEQAAARFGLPPRQVMVLEDSENGCRAAVSAGAFAVAVPGGHSRNHDFRGAQFVAETLADPRIYAALRLAPATD
ncbi:MAG TPA: HAD family phosphatase [Pirellulales bacterium]